MKKNRLRQLRHARHWSQRTLALKVGIDVSLVSRHESGERTISPAHLAAYKRIFGESVE